jgi:hypothetical protein
VRQAKTTVQGPNSTVPNSTGSSATARLLGAGSIGVLALLPGCVDRKIRITSEPPGARVWLNDTEIGLTPTEADFKFYGRYDVRLEKDGFEPLWTDKKAYAPVWQWPGLDLAADLIPARFDDVIEWHFDLEPRLESVSPPEVVREELIERARALGARTAPPVPVDD